MTFIPRRERSDTVYALWGLAAIVIIVIMVVVLVAGFNYFRWAHSMRVLKDSKRIAITDRHLDDDVHRFGRKVTFFTLRAT